MRDIATLGGKVIIRQQPSIWYVRTYKRNIPIPQMPPIFLKRADVWNKTKGQTMSHPTKMPKIQ